MHFSIRWMLFALLLVSALFGVLFASSDVVAMLLLWTIVITCPAIPVAMIVYGQGATRAFGIGAGVFNLLGMGGFMMSSMGVGLMAADATEALVTMVETFFPTAEEPGEAFTLKCYVLLAIVWTVLSGAMSVAIRWACLPVEKTSSVES